MEDGRRRTRRAHGRGGGGTRESAPVEQRGPHREGQSMGNQRQSTGKCGNQWALTGSEALPSRRTAWASTIKVSAIEKHRGRGTIPASTSEPTPAPTRPRQLVIDSRDTRAFAVCLASSSEPPWPGSPNCHAPASRHPALALVREDAALKVGAEWRLGRRSLARRQCCEHG